MTRVKIPKSARCPGCGKMVFEAGGLYRCRKCGGFDPQHKVIYRHVPMREQFSYEDPTRTKPIDGRPIPLDHRIK